MLEFREIANKHAEQLIRVVLNKTQGISYQNVAYLGILKRSCFLTEIIFYSLECILFGVGPSNTPKLPSVSSLSCLKFLIIEIFFFLFFDLTQSCLKLSPNLILCGTGRHDPRVSTEVRHGRSDLGVICEERRHQFFEFLGESLPSL